MSAKEKVDKGRKIHIKVTIKGIISFLSFIVILLYMIIFYNFYFVKNNVYATASTIRTEETVEISKAKQIDIDDIISQNTKQGQKEEYSVEEIDLEYITTYRNNQSLPKETLQVVQEGRNGKQEVTIKRTYQNGELISEEQISSKITKASVNKIVEIGTANYVSQYKAKVGDSLSITSDRLSVRFEPNEQSQKVATLSSKDKVKILEIQGDWYKISSSSIIGYVKAESTRYIDNTEKQEGNSSSKNKSELLAGLSFEMALNKPSGLSLEQFKKILSDSKDTNKIFENNAQYFYYIEKQYNINGVFVAAIRNTRKCLGNFSNSKK